PVFATDSLSPLAGRGPGRGALFTSPSFTTVFLTPEHNRRLEVSNLADAQRSCQPADEKDCAQRNQWQLPGHEERRHAFLEDEGAEDGCESNAAAVADQADGQSLEHYHAGEDAVGGAHGFERAKVAQVFQNERVKCLATDGDADDKAQEHGRAEGNRNTGLLDVPPDGDPKKFALGVGLEP